MLVMEVRFLPPEQIPETRLRVGHVPRAHALVGSIPASPTITREARQLVKPAVLQTALAGFDPLASYRCADGRLP